MMKKPKVIFKTALYFMMVCILFCSTDAFARLRKTNSTPLKNRINATSINNKPKATVKNKAANSDDDEADCPYSDCPDGEYCTEYTNGCCYKCAEYPPDKQPLPVRQAQ